MNGRALIAGSIVLGGLLLVGAGLAGMKYWQIRALESMPPPPERSEAIAAVRVEPIDWRPTARLSGTAFARQWVTLSNEVAGTVEEVLFESGSTVERGQVLLRLDTSTQQADLDAARASVRVSQANALAAESNLRLREANHRRMLRAGDDGAVTESELDQSLALLDQAKAQLEQARAEIDQAQSRARQLEATITKMTLTAPFRARVNLRNVHPGQYLAEGASVVGLQSIDDRIHLDFAVPQDQAWRVRKGDVVMASVPMLSNEPQPIEVVAIDAVADRGTRNVRVRGEIANPGERIRPGMWVDVEVPIEAPSRRLAVPSTAVRRAPYGDHVFVIEEDPAVPGRFVARQRVVKLGPAVGNAVIIDEGLEPGDLVAADGSFKLTDGGVVRPGPMPGAATQTAAAGSPGAAPRGDEAAP